MPGDRTAALRAAEKLLRLGKLQLAIAAYTSLVQEHPQDWDSAVLLATLHLRTRDVDAAVARFAEVGDALCLAGEVARATDIYKRILAVRPGDEHALRQSVALAKTDGRADEARQYLSELADGQLARGDAGAAADTLAEAAALDPSDAVLRERVFDLALQAGHLDRAREHASTAAHYRTLAHALQSAGRMDEAVALLRDAVHHDPDHLPTVAQLARVLVAQGDAVGAAEYLTPAMAGTHPEARLGLVEVLLRGGRTDAALELARRTVADNPETVDALARLASLAAPHVPDAAVALVDIAVLRWTAHAQWEPAAAALQQFVSRAPGCIDAMVRLVEVAVDGDLASTACHAQEMLADAYLATGAVAEGLAIAEDLAAREPGNPVHVARVRQAQELMRAAEAGAGAGSFSSDAVRGAPTVLPFRVSAAS
jgi:tetratricopeptide (TPR) repeat protein